MDRPPPNVVKGIASYSDIRTKRSLMATAKEIEEIVRESIQTLQALDGCIPSMAWDLYKNADGLYFKYDIIMQLDAVVFRMATSIVDASPRIKRLLLSQDFGGRSTGALQSLVDALSSRAHMLQQLVWHIGTPPSIIDTFLPLLTKLQALEIHCRTITFRSMQTPWKPQFPATLTSLYLKGNPQWAGDGPYLQVDLSPLTALTALQHLKLECMDVVNFSSISSLVSLSSLSLSGEGLSSPSGINIHGVSLSLSELVPLNNLTSLTFDGAITQQAWATLAQLPALADLSGGGLAVDVPAAAAPLAQLTRFQGPNLGLQALLHAAAPPAAAPAGTAKGLLTLGLPSLQAFSGRVDVPAYPFFKLLMGHTALQHLHCDVIWDDAGSDRQQDWLQPVLSTMPALTYLYFRDSGHPVVHNADALMADLAACTQLRSIRIHKQVNSHASSRISAAGVRALAAAAWLPQVTELRLGIDWQRMFGVPPKQDQSWHLTLEEALPLLTAPMPRLQCLKLPVQPVPEEQLLALAQRLGRPLEVLRGQLCLPEA